jgi:trimethylamine--corrinoid protein Co-methyltransferase
MGALAGYNLIYAQTGMLESCLTVSYEQSVIDNEIAGMVFRILRGSEISERTLTEAYDLIKSVAPLGTHYLNKEHTRKNFLKEDWQPTISDRYKWDVWVKRGRKGALELAREKAKLILQEHRIEPLPQEILTKINQIAKEET